MWTNRYLVFHIVDDFFRYLLGQEIDLPQIPAASKGSSNKKDTYSIIHYDDEVQKLQEITCSLGGRYH